VWPSVSAPVVATEDAPGDVARPRRRRIAPIISLLVAVVFGALFVVLAGSDPGRDETVSSFLIDKPAPAVVSTTLDGQPFDLSRRKGSWVLFNFFDPSCVPCKLEHPELIELARQQRALGTAGAELYTIINRGSDDDVRTYFETYGGDWPIVRDPGGKISVTFGVAQVPETWVIDPSGVVRARFAGQVTAEGVGALLQQLREQTA
jgi:cytochrome c biogenesis protein CcmG, thiol:disulfide interchange protein DsbE